MIALPRSAKQRAIAWARVIWGSCGLAGVLPHNKHCVIGRAEEGFLGPGIAIFGRGADWETALTDAKETVELHGPDAPRPRGWTSDIHL